MLRHRQVRSPSGEDSITSASNSTSSRIARILAVEDFAAHRLLVSSLLKRRPDLQLIWEASNGVEAVRKAEELQPDLILMDIGLPVLNGIDAARQIRKLAPNSRIIFLTQESSPEVWEEATLLGAHGYVFKSEVQTDLLTAVDFALEGKRFCSGSHERLG